MSDAVVDSRAFEPPYLLTRKGSCTALGGAALRRARRSGMPSDGDAIAVRSTLRIRWWRLAAVALLSAALALTVSAGSIIGSIIIAVLLLPSVAILVMWFIAWRQRRLKDEK